MKKQLVILLLIALGLFPAKWFSQPGGIFQTLTPGGTFDHVSDQSGNEYPLINLSLNAARPISTGSYSIGSIPTNSCSAGYFDLYFAPGSLFDQNVSAANVICEVYRENISGLISSGLSLTPGVGQRVSVYCDNIQAGTPTSVLGLGGLFYLYPYNANNPTQGLIDGQLQKALLSGQDPFANLPLSLFPGASNFYSSYMYVNPTPPLGTWNYNMATTSISSGEYDLYTIMLHEVMHTLGFNSLINSSGVSLIGASNSYFSRYDQYLTDASGTTPLLAPVTGTCPTSSLVFQTPTTAINPSLCAGGNSNSTTCSSAARYISPNVNVKVYTPDCFENGSSLSHFEDMCSYGSFTTSCVPSPISPGYSDLYFVMSNSSGLGNCYVKRHLTEEERYVLCDLGYAVSNTYTSNAAGASYTYAGSSCPGANIWGINDGLSGPVYTYTTTGSTYTVPLLTIVANDTPSIGITVSCPEVVYNTATVAIAGPNLSVTAAAGAGLVVVKYYPINNVNGQIGNATYVFIYFLPANCNVSACNMVQNGDLESVNPGMQCGAMSSLPGNGPQVNCWFAECATPDLITRSCTNGNPPGLDVNMGVDVWGTTLDSHNGSPNNRMIGFGGETVKNNLGAPLVPGQTYQISVWLYNFAGNPNVSAFTTSSIVVDVLADVNITNIIGCNASALPVISEFTVPPYVWTQFTNTFVFNPANVVNHNVILLQLNLTQNAVFNNGNPGGYCFFDDISINALSGGASPSFSIPSAANCGNVSFTNLGQYANFTGTFSGTGVTSSTSGTVTTYNFNSPPTLTPGVYPVAFTYTDSGTGCVNTISQNIILNSPNFTVTAYGDPVYCTNFSPPIPPVTLSASCTQTSGVAYIWQPGNLSGITATTVPLATQVYTLYALGNCLTTTTLAVTVSSNCCTSTITPLTAAALSTGSLTGSWIINGDLNINSGQVLDFAGGEFLVAPGVKINVNPGGALSVRNSHFYACSSDMWQGIVIKDGGLANLIPDYADNLIEDALIAVDISNNTTSTLTSILSATNTTFNKNYIGIHISNYVRSSSSYPFSITGCVFTSRDFTYTPTTWVQSTALRTGSTITTLASPYLLGNVPVTNLINPYTSQSAQTGIQLDNVGRTVLPAIYPVAIGSSNASASFNLFDALGYGINANESNVNSYNNVFQNTQVINGTTGAGIRASNSYSNTALYDSWLSLSPVSSPSTNINYFYDCHTGVRINNTGWFTATYALFQSSQSSLSTPTPTDPGQYGIYLTGNRYNDYELNNNNFLNLGTGIYGGVTNTVISASAYGQVWGSFNIKNNLFRPSTSMVNNNEYLSNGIVIESLLFSKGLAGSFVALTPLTGLHVQFNTFKDVWRGMLLRNFQVNQFAKATADNLFSLSQDVTSGNPQWAIRYESIAGGLMNTNGIFGFGTSTVNPVSGIYSAYNTLCGTQCNSLVTLPISTNFSGLNTGAIWANNTMSNCARGMQLSNTGVIGTQGSFSAPRDNVWQGSWSPPDWNTFTDASYAISSPYWRRTTSGYDPLNNSGTLGANSYSASLAALLAASNSANGFTCLEEVPRGTIDWPGNQKLMNKLVALRQMPPIDKDTTFVEIDDMQAYRLLYQDSTYRVSDDTLKKFFNTYDLLAIGILTHIEELFAEGDLATANSLLGGFTPTTTIQHNYVDYYNLYSSYAATGTLSGGDQSALLAIADKCPHTDGLVVYNARALYNLVSGLVVLYADEACEVSGSSALRTIGSNIAKQKQASANYKLFPNPAVDELYIFGTTETETIDMTICDVNGRKLMDQQLSIHSYVASLKLNLINGVYFVSLVNQNHERLVKKLVIAK